MEKEKERFVGIEKLQSTFQKCIAWEVYESNVINIDSAPARYGYGATTAQHWTTSAVFEQKR